MRTRIDTSGRVVIPAALRKRKGLMPGVEVEMTADNFGVRLFPVTAGARLVNNGRRLIARPTLGVNRRSQVNIEALIDEERHHRTH